MFIGQDETGIHGVYEQRFAPERVTTSLRRKLAAFEIDGTTESLGISPDGKRLVIANWDELWNLMLAEHVPGIRRTRHQ